MGGVCHFGGRRRSVGVQGPSVQKYGPWEGTVDAVHQSPHMTVASLVFHTKALGKSTDLIDLFLMGWDEVSHDLSDVIESFYKRRSTHIRDSTHSVILTKMEEIRWVSICRNVHYDLLDKLILLNRYLQ